MRRYYKMNKIMIPENGWHTEDDIRSILQYEKERGQISGKTPSVVIFDAAMQFETDQQKKDFRHFFHQIISLITYFSRKSDIKYLSDAQKIGVVLLDTKLSGAKTYQKRLSQLMTEYFQKSEYQHYYSLFTCMDISIYTLNQMMQQFLWTDPSDTAQSHQSRIVNFK